MRALVVGGSRGLGAEIARLVQARGAEVVTTGRKEFAAGADSLVLLRDTESLLDRLPSVDLLVYAAGFYEHGHINDLPGSQILETLNTTLAAPALLVQGLLRRQKELGGFIAVTSTSQWRPREYEPVYAAGKSGLGMFAASVALDPAIKKTLVVGPAGMDTDFWRGPARAGTALLRPESVARHVLELWDGAFTYRAARILRDPERVEILESR